MKISLRTKLMALILLVLILAVGVLSYQGLRFFHRDKTTYVFDLISQVVVVQAQELDKKMQSLRNMMEIFSEVAGYNISVTQRESLLHKYDDFLFIATFNVQATDNAVSLADDLVIANRQRLQSMGFNAGEIKNDKLLLANVAKATPFYVFNFTRIDLTPAVALLYRPTPERLVVGVVSQNAITDISSTKKIYQTFVVDQQGEIVMHYDGMALLQRENLKGNPMVASWVANPNLPLTKEYAGDAAQNSATVLGAYAGLSKFPMAVFVQVPKEEAFLAARRLIQSSSLLAAAVFLLSCLIGALFAYGITRPLRKLAQLTERIAKGDFTAKTDIKTHDEIGELAKSFNSMTTELTLRDEKLEEQNKQLVQSEKMSAFGQMSAGIAHEVKNPLAGILGYAQLARRKLEETSPIAKYLDIIEKETKRCKEIVENLMRFARQEKMALEPFAVNQAIRDAIALVDHQISIHGVKIIQELVDDKSLPQVVGSANQLQQVLMNLMLNAQHAMEGGGTLTVRSKSAGPEHVLIQVADTGTGIAPENLKKIFEPFFTTKPAGKGTGLGLAVTYGIIKEHHGEITVDSTVGKGTTFNIKLPAAGSKAAPSVSQSVKPAAAAGAAKGA